MGKIIPFRRASGSWDAEFRIHNPDTCTKVARRIACDACGYPYSEALYSDEADWRKAQNAPPTCHDDITWLDFKDYITDVRTQDDPDGSKET